MQVFNVAYTFYRSAVRWTVVESLGLESDLPDLVADLLTLAPMDYYDKIIKEN
jgi:hypothetical protein